jgi:hypothetical protein
MTQQLSPAAQAVLDAINKELYEAPGAWEASHSAMAAVALRAAADQMRYSDQLGLTGFGGYVQAQDQILAIAAELEANS